MSVITLQLIMLLMNTVLYCCLLLGIKLLLLVWGLLKFCSLICPLRNFDFVKIILVSFFYPRPVLAFRYCCCLRVYVCVFVCVCQSLACPHDNSWPVQARITKFGSDMWKTLVKISIVLWSNRPWPSRSNLTCKVQIYPILSFSAP